MIRPTIGTLAKAAFAALAVSAIVFAVFVLVAPATEAAPSSNCTYYNNAAHTTVVGKFGKDCCNNTVAWGIKTQFKVCGGCFVCFPPPR